MTTKSTFKVLFLTQKGKPRPDGRVPVVARITLNGQMAHFHTSVDVAPDSWLPKEGRTAGANREEKEANSTLDDYRVLIRQKYNELMMNGEVVTASRVKLAVTSQDEKSYNLLDICKEFVEDYHKLVITGSVTLCTYQRYVLTRERLSEFIKSKYRVADLPISQINHSFIKGFDLHNRTEHRAANNTAARFVKHFRTMFDLALNNGWVRTDPFANYKIQLEKVNRGYLTQEELDAMTGKEFTNKRLEAIRDMFLFSVYTGLAYIDVRELTKENIEYREDGSVWLTTTRQKTNNPVILPLLALPAQIIEKYRDTAKNGRLLPIPSNQKVNDYLKEIAALCGIEKSLTFHLARHTFATTVTLENGVPIETVSRMLGHNSIKTTQIYARITASKIGHDMGMLAAKLNNQAARVM
jgi:site-specific recombinase XerD